MKLTKAFFLTFALVFTEFAVAQTSEPATPPASAITTVQRGKKSQVVKLNYDDELVTGVTMKPDIDSVNLRKTFNFKKIIRVRDNFMNEMEDSVDSFKGN